MARAGVIDLTALDSDDEDTPEKNVALVQRLRSRRQDQGRSGTAARSPAASVVIEEPGSSQPVVVSASVGERAKQLIGPSIHVPALDTSAFDVGTDA